jgi:kynurenine formamidase
MRSAWIPWVETMARSTREVRFSRLVDLSQDIGPDTQMFPAYPQPTFTPWTTREVHGFLAESLFLVSHTGTHVDAPFHMEPAGKTIDRVPLDRFFAPAHVLDLHLVPSRGRIGPAELRAARSRLGRRVSKGDAVLVRTGWERKRGTPAYLTENPGLTTAGGRLLAGWGVSLVGIDAPNVDVAGDTRYGAHHALLAEGIPVLENVANLAAVGTRPFTLAAFPLRLRGASGSPVRLVALVA